MSLICVPVCVNSLDELPEAMARAAALADIIELRLDCLDDFDGALRFLDTHWKQINRPAIVTMRSPEEGGRMLLDYEQRRRFWLSCPQLPEQTYVDLELDLVRDFSADEQALPFDWNRVICSHHDFSGVPSDIDWLYERMAATPARVHKIAVRAEDATDCIPIFRLLERARAEQRKLIAIAMGESGVMTRILGPARGSFLTYAALDKDSATAPGQLTAKDLRGVYRIDQINRDTEIFGVLGNPVKHSLSPQIHNAAFADLNLNAVYIPFQVNDANEFMRRMVQPRSREIEWNLRGLSVTAPHKMTVMGRLDWIEPTAKEIRAVNTIIVREGELHGYNTDVIGFMAPLRAKLGSLKDFRCAIIGAGGAARAALCALTREGAQVGLFVRDPSRADFIAHQFHAKCNPLAGASFRDFDVVVNATPLGTKGEREAETSAVAEQLRGVRLAYDLVYNPPETRFINEARAAGCETLGGIEMLLAQAVEQFKLWIGKEPSLDVMRAAAMKSLVESS